MKHAIFWMSAAFLFWHTISWAQPEVSTVPEMLKLLARDSDPSRNRFLNEQRVDLYRHEISVAPDFETSIQLRLALSTELLRAGQARESILELEALYSELAPLSNITADRLQKIRRHIAVAYLRLGEIENCLDHHHTSSCLIPFDSSGIHHVQAGSRQAIKWIEKWFTASDRSMMWLLNIAYMTIGLYPDSVPSQCLISPQVFSSDGHLPVFKNMATPLGIDHAALAGGAVVADFDGDGYLDLIVSSWGLRDPLKYYHNNRNGTFSDWTVTAGVSDQIGGLHLIQADYDSDGDIDILVLRGAWLGAFGLQEGNFPNSLLCNDGRGHFTDVTMDAGLLTFSPTQTAAWADFDLDGHLDLFIGNESTLDPDESAVINAHRCSLFRNQGDGTFVDVAAEVGLDHIGFVKGVAWGDFDQDGWPDIYISQHGQPNVLFRNDGPQESGSCHFTNVTKEAGVGEPALSFATWFWDYDNDGWLDLFVAAYENFYGDALESVVIDYLGGAKTTYSRLFKNQRDGTFLDVTEQLTFDAVLLAMGANFGDLDNDGFLDAYFGTGQPALTTLVPNRMFRNNAGERFEDVTSTGGFGHVQKGHGIAFSDLDHDGDEDIYAVMGGAYSGDVYPNALFLNPGTKNNWIKLSLKGAAGSNRGAVGARLRLVLDDREGGREIHRVVGWGSSFGNIAPGLDIGVGKSKKIRLLEIIWPDRKQTKTTYKNLPVNRLWEVQQNEKEPRHIKLEPLHFNPAK